MPFSASVSALDLELDRRPTNLAQLLLQIAERFPASGIHSLSADLRAEPERQSYSELLEEARRILSGLLAHGRPVGTKVALLLDQPRDFIPAFWACVLGGFVPCPLTAIQGDRERWAHHLAYVAELLHRPLLVTRDPLDVEVAGLQAVQIETLRAASAHPGTWFAGFNETALLVLTSGSTGNSKAVALTHANLLASMAAKAECQQLTEEDVTLNWISFDHVAALLEAHLFPLYVGATQLHVSPAAVLADPLLFLREIARHRVTMTFTPNFLLGHINAALQANALEPGTLDLSGLRHIISGGEAIVVETGRRFLDLLAPHGLARTALWPAFGMTETCAGSVYSREFPDSDPDREFASLGLPVAGLQIRIVSPQDVPVGEGEPGELQVRGPMVFREYYNNEAATRAAFTADGWFRTGDLGRLDKGRLSLVGRSKDSIIVSGVNYFSHELETVLETLDGVERSYVAAFPTRPKGADTEQLVIAFAPTFPLEDEPALHRLIVAIRSTTVLLWGFRPALILPLPRTAVPKTSLGKTQRTLLRHRLEAGVLKEHESYVAEVTLRQLGGYVPPECALETAVAEIFASLFDVPASTISATASFFDLGGTSLDILRLKMQIERRLSAKALPIITILQNPTVRGLAAYLSGAAGEATTREYDPVVPLQLSGNKTPLFCVHPGVGEVLVFVNLAKYFVNERPFYALRARGFNPGESFFSRFDEMVATYVAAIRRRQPHGPYAVAGYSYGAAVAFEIAKALEAAGERVDFVGSFNLPPHIKYRMDELDSVEGAVNLAFFLSLITKQQSLELPAQLRAALPGQDPCEHLILIAPPARLAELDLDLDKFRAWSRLAQSLLDMGKTFTPSGNVESLTVFYAIPLRGTKEDWLNRELRRWDDHARKPNRYIDVAGEHYTMLGPRHVASFQAVLRAELDRALSGR